MQFEFLLSHSEFDYFCSFVDKPAKRVEILASYLKDKMFTYESNFYILDSQTITYSKNELYNCTPEKAILSYCSNLLQQSFSKLSVPNQNELFDAFPLLFKNGRIFKNTYCSSLVTDLLFALDKTGQIDFKNPYKYEIHFNNGYFDLRTMELKSRVLGQHYVTKFIKRNYIDPSEEAMNYVHSQLRKIIHCDDERNYLLFVLGKSLSGDSNLDQNNLFLIGHGSTGKSTFMQMVQHAISNVYLIELKSNTFSEGNTKIDKILNELVQNPLLRYAWVNELEDKKVDSSLFKSFCEGHLQTTTLYKDGLVNYTHNAKLILTANYYPKIEMDSGVVRRILGYFMKSLFTSDPAQVSEENHVYLVNPKFTSDYESSADLKNAMFKILASYCYDYVRNKTYKKPSSFDDVCNDIVESNQTCQITDFFEKYLDITGNEQDRLTKKVFIDTFRAKYPLLKNITDRMLIRSLEKYNNIKWNRQARNNEGTKGAYLGVKMKTQQLTDTERFHVLETELQTTKNENKRLQTLLDLYQSQQKKPRKN